MMTLKQQALWYVIRFSLIMITVAVIMGLSLHYLGIILTGVLITLVMLTYVMYVVYHMELRRLEAEHKEQERGR
jgi:Flp pilus assembly protein TadB